MAERARLRLVNPDGAAVLAAKCEDLVEGFKTLNVVSLQSPDPYLLSAAVLYRESAVIFQKQGADG